MQIKKAERLALRPCEPEDRLRNEVKYFTRGESGVGEIKLPLAAGYTNFSRVYGD